MPIIWIKLHPLYDWLPPSCLWNQQWWTGNSSRCSSFSPTTHTAMPHSELFPDLCPLFTPSFLELWRRKTATGGKWDGDKMPFSSYLFIIISVRTFPKKTQKTTNPTKPKPPKSNDENQTPKFHCPQQIPLSSGSSQFAFWYPFNIDSLDTGNYHKFCHV